MRRGLLLVLVLAGCSSTRAELRSQLGAQASEYLRCPEPGLEYTELDRLISTTKVKVTGCGKDVTYQLVESRWEKARLPAPR